MLEKDLSSKPLVFTAPGRDAKRQCLRDCEEQLRMPPLSSFSLKTRFDLGEGVKIWLGG